MRTASDDLFRLVKSMTPEEKRHFRSQARQYKGDKHSNTLQLFDLVDAQPQHDEASLVQAMGLQATPNRFAVAKHYLYQTLLKSMAQYLGERGPTKRIRQDLRMVEVLFHKELFGQCERLLERAARDAQAYAHPALQLEVLDWQRRIWNKRHFKEVTADDVAAHGRSVDAAIASLGDLWGLQHLHTQFMHILRTRGFLHGHEALQQMFAGVVGAPLLQRAAETHDLHARIPFLHTWGIYKTLSGDHVAAHHYLSALMAELDAQPEIAYDYFEFYVNAQFNYGTTCLRLDRYAELERCIHQLERLRGTFASQKARLFACTYQLRVEYHAGRGQLDQALRETEEAIPKLGQYRHLLSAAEHISVSITAAFLLFVHGKLRECHRLMVAEMRPEIVGHNADLHVAVETMRLILYLEMGEEDLLEQGARALGRYLGHVGRPFALESELLRHLPRLLRAQTPAAARSIYAQLHARYLALQADPSETRPVPYFNFGVWLHARAEGIDLLQALRSAAPASQQ